MSHLEWLLIAITVLLIVGCCGRFGLWRRPELHDLLWRSILVAIAISPAVPVLRLWLVDRQFSLAVLPAMMPASEGTSESLPGRSELTGAQDSHADNPVAASSNRLSDLIRRRLSDNTPTREGATSETVDVPADFSAGSAESQAVAIRSHKSTTSDRQRSAWPLILVGTWLVGFCFHLLRIACAAWNVRRLLSTASSVMDPAVRELVKWCADRIGARSDVTLACSNQVHGPVVTGLFRPVILIPPSLLTIAARGDLRLTLLHECGHVRRHDLAFDLLLRLVTSVLWFHPLVYVMNLDLRRLREELCDNYVLAEERPVVYAEVLLRLSVEQRLHEAMLIGLGMFSRLRRLESRVDAILSDDRALATHATRRVRWISATGAVICLVCAVVVRIDRISVIAQESASSIAQKSDGERVGKDPSSKGPLDAGNETSDLSSANSEASATPTIDVTIVDTNGNPVANAKVKPWGVTVQHGAFGFDDEWSTTTSDANGRVSVSLPPKLAMAAKAMRGENHSPIVDEIGLKIDHPVHPVWSQYLDLRRAHKVTLTEAVTIKIRAYRGEGDQLARRLYPRLSHSHSTDWADEEGVLIYRRVDLSTHPTANWLRVAQLPEHGAAWFSDVIDLNHRSEDEIELDVRLKPGVRVEGVLDEQVPRPINNGYVAAAAVHTGTGQTNQSTWFARAEVAADGTFAFESLPPNETLQLMAFSDGWVSRSPLQSETVDYAARHQFPHNSMDKPSAGMLLPQLLWLGESTAKTTIRMLPTSTCEVTTIDEQGQPVPDVEVRFQPNQMFHHWGSGSLGIVQDDTELVRGIFRTGKPDYRAERRLDDDRFVMKTNAKGVATITGLPGVEEGMANAPSAIFSAYNQTMIGVQDIPVEGTELYGLPLMTTSLTAGRTERITVRMTTMVMTDLNLEAENDDTISETRRTLPRDQMPNTLAGRVQDERGKPLEGVRLAIDLLMPELEMPDEVRQMLDRWNRTAIVTDHDGRFRHQFDEAVDCGDEPTLPVRLVKEGYASDIVMMRLDRPNPAVTLHASTLIEGTVRGLDGQPVANAVVRSCHPVKFPSEPDFEQNFWVETRTDEQGRYQLQIKPGKHVFIANQAGVASAWLPKRTEGGVADSTSRPKRSASERASTWIAPHEKRTLDFQLEPSVDFQARAINSLTGAPLPGVILALDEYPDMFGKTDQSGIAVIHALPIGKLTFNFGAEGYLRVWSDDAETGWKEAILQRGGVSTMVAMEDGVQFELKPGMPIATIAFEPAIRIRGQVLDPDGQPIANAYVEPFRSSSLGSMRMPGRSGHTDDAGKFSVLSSPADVDQLRLAAYDNRPQKRSSPPESDPQRPTRWASGASDAIQANLGEAVKNVVIRLTRPGVIRGRAVDAQGRPLAFVEIDSTCVDAYEGRYHRPSAKTDRKGQFELRDVRPGRHRLSLKTSDEAVPPSTGLPEVQVNEGETVMAGDVALSRDEPAKP